jgi:hypothetical protein
MFLFAALFQVLVGVSPTTTPPFAGSLPPAPVTWKLDCVTTDPASPHVRVDYSAAPFEALHFTMANVAPNVPMAAVPLIAQVLNSSNNQNVADGKQKIIATLNGVPFTVFASATVQYWSLYADSSPTPVATGAGRQFADGTQRPLPSPFYVRWNDLPEVGPHYFRLLVYDAGLNVAERQWMMTR